MKKIIIMAPEGAEEMEIAPFVEIPGWTKIVPDVEKVDVDIVGWEQTITLGHGLKIIPDLMIEDVNIEVYDGLCIPGGWPHTRYFKQINQNRCLEMIKTMYSRRKIIATLCFGIFALGEAGLLNNIKATTYVGDDIELSKVAGDKLKSYGADYIEKSIVINERIISNIGPAVASEVAFRMIEMLTSESDVKKIRDMMLYPHIRKDDLKWTGQA